MAITIPQISIDEVYISVLKAKLVKNEEGWSKMMAGPLSWTPL